MDFILRIYADKTRIPILSDLQNITISGITLISKPTKHSICYHNGNKKKFGYSIELSKPFNMVSGSHNYPNLSFKGEYIDILIKNFPRYPAFYQDKYEARNIMNNMGHNSMNRGFPKQLLYRDIEILQLH